MVSTDGRTHVSDGETTARWGVVARSPMKVMKVMNRVWSGRYPQQLTLRTLC